MRYGGCGNLPEDAGGDERGGMEVLADNIGKGQLCEGGVDGELWELGVLSGGLWSGYGRCEST